MSKITHEEARFSVTKWQKDKTIYSYITQQEKKDELLELYREKDLLIGKYLYDEVSSKYFNRTIDKIKNKIKELEKELQDEKI